MKIKCMLIRHGKTQGNIEKRYIGCRTDEPLLEESLEMMGFIGDKIRALYGEPNQIFVSPMLRCRQTAENLFPGIQQMVAEDLRETDFGDFENKNYEELCGDPEYQSWIDSNGTKPFPGGESRDYCIERTVSAFQKALESIASDCMVAFVIHGGSIMAIMSAMTHRDYYDFQVSCCDGFMLECLIEDGKVVDVSYDSLFGGHSA